MQKKKGGGEEKCLPWLYDEQNCLDEAFVRNVIMSANAYS